MNLRVKIVMRIIRKMTWAGKRMMADGETARRIGMMMKGGRCIVDGDKLMVCRPILGWFICPSLFFFR